MPLWPDPAARLTAQVKAARDRMRWARTVDEYDAAERETNAALDDLWQLLQSRAGA